MDNRKVSLVALLDPSAAFGTIDHSSLFSRFQKSFGFQGNVFKWFESYLSNGFQSVTVKNCISAPDLLHYCVPQGSVLGPLLFILYTKPLSDSISSHNCSFYKYANDTELEDSAKADSFPSVKVSIENCKKKTV